MVMKQIFNFLSKIHLNGFFFGFSENLPQAIQFYFVVLIFDKKTGISIQKISNRNKKSGVICSIFC